MPAMGGTSLLLGPDREGRVLLLTGDQIAHFGGSEATSVSSDIEYPCPSSRIHPGQVNAHTHIYSGLVPLGMPPPEHEPENFVQILERVWWRLDRALDQVQHVFSDPDGSLPASQRFCQFSVSSDPSRGNLVQKNQQF